MQQLGKALIFVGILITVFGVFFVAKDQLPFLRWFGKLPGDIVIQRESFKLYFPITTCLLLSVVMTMVSWAIRK